MMHNFKFLVLIVLLFTTLSSAAQGISVSLGDVQKLNVFGFAQTHFDVVNSSGQTDNDFAIKRIILIGDAQLSEQISFWLMVDAASTSADKILHEYYLQYAFRPWLKLRVGQFKTPYTIENILPISLLGSLHMNQSVRYMAGVAGDPAYGAFAGRDLGIMLTGDFLPASDGHPLFNYNVGLFNGSGMNQRDRDNAKDVIAMLNYSPLKWLKFSVSGIVGHNTALNGNTLANIAANDYYSRRRLSFGTQAHWQRFNLRSECMMGRDNNTNSHGAYAELWIRTLPKLDLVLDFDHLDLNAYTTNNYTIGLQYWFYKSCRLATQYVYTHKSLSSIPATHQVLTQFQLSF